MRQEWGWISDMSWQKQQEWRVFVALCPRISFYKGGFVYLKSLRWREKWYLHVHDTRAKVSLITLDFTKHRGHIKKKTFFSSLFCVYSLLLLSSSVTGMKRPFSQLFVPNPELEPSGVGTGPLEEMDMESCCNIQDSPEPEGQSPGGVLRSSLHRPKRERKQRTYTLCEVCNIQLNSSTQAQIHYNGKSHQKRLKKISQGKMPNSTGRAVVIHGCCFLVAKCRTFSSVLGVVAHPGQAD